MSLKRFKLVKILVIIALAITVSQSILYNNYIIPIFAVAVSFALLMSCKRRVKEVIADERDYEIGGKAARVAIQIFSWIAVVIMFVLYSYRDASSVCEAIGLTLAYSVCFLMILYSALFYFFNKK